MDDFTKKSIIEDYKNGIGSTTLIKKYNINKQKILKLLNEHNLIRKKDRCKFLEIKEDEKGYYVSRTCPKCKKDIRTYSKEKIIACRNHYRKLNGTALCKLCARQNLKKKLKNC